MVSVCKIMFYFDNNIFQVGGWLPRMTSKAGPLQHSCNQSVELKENVCS